MESTRVDRWLWAVRLFKTRSDATAACRAGHVRVNGRAAKPASLVSVGDRVEAQMHRRVRIAEVRRVIDTRVGAAIAVDCYHDHSPDVPVAERVRVAERERGSGRPTKKQRRQLERWRSRNR